MRKFPVRVESYLKLKILCRPRITRIIHHPDEIVQGTSHGAGAAHREKIITKKLRASVVSVTSVKMTSFSQGKLKAKNYYCA
jgi:hypothetical protein